MKLSKREKKSRIKLRKSRKELARALKLVCDNYCYHRELEEFLKETECKSPYFSDRVDFYFRRTWGQKLSFAWVESNLIDDYFSRPNPILSMLRLAPKDFTGATIKEPIEFTKPKGAKNASPKKQTRQVRKNRRRKHQSRKVVSDGKGNS